jgi:hypothetical protein
MNFAELPKRIVDWQFARSEAGKNHLLIEADEPLPDLFAKNMANTPVVFNNATNTSLSPAVVYVMQGIAFTTKRYEFFTASDADTPESWEVHVARGGDYMGRIGVITIGGIDHMVVTSRNVHRKRKPSNLDHNQKMTRDINNAIEIAKSLFVPVLPDQRKQECELVISRMFSTLASLKTDIIAPYKKYMRYVENKSHDVHRFTQMMLYFALKNAQGLAGVAWDEESVDWDAAIHKHMKGFDIDDFIKTYELMAKRVLQRKNTNSKGCIVQINKNNIARLVSPINLAEKVFAAAELLPPDIVEDCAVLKAAGAGNYVDGVGVFLCEDKFDSFHKYVNTLFYLEKKDIQ